ncbi:uncharacterized protein LOC108309414 [Cebus imitator]|uniref:uncharacterized protein LOC108309414 n=1 Tax=Cebus imitator TaxID=2715852 RepID=UPI00189A89BD|nr:uncharacterized protein LOC108309414 [Cebus imitator]
MAMAVGLSGTPWEADLSASFFSSSVFGDHFGRSFKRRTQRGQRRQRFSQSRGRSRGSSSRLLGALPSPRADAGRWGPRPFRGTRNTRRPRVAHGAPFSALPLGPETRYAHVLLGAGGDRGWPPPCSPCLLCLGWSGERGVTRADTVSPATVSPPHPLQASSTPRGPAVSSAPSAPVHLSSGRAGCGAMRKTEELAGPAWARTGPGRTG